MPRFLIYNFNYQDKIDNADSFEVCLTRFTKWLEEHELGIKHKFSIVTDGPFDMARFLYGQCLVSFKIVLIKI